MAGRSPIEMSLAGSSIEVAPAILGWELSVLNHHGERLTGRIVETEAYHQDDAASHSFKGLTPRTAPMFAKAGTVYVYFTYGMHYCMNIVCGPEGRGEAVLLRALEPLTGLDVMRQNRGLASNAPERLIASGPARLAQALGITTKQSGSHLDEGIITLTPRPQKFTITQTTRVGIRQAADAPWRFYITDSTYISKA